MEVDRAINMLLMDARLGTYVKQAASKLISLCPKYVLHSFHFISTVIFFILSKTLILTKALVLAQLIISCVYIHVCLPMDGTCGWYVHCSCALVLDG